MDGRLLACLLAGGVVVPLRATLTPDMLCFVLQDTEAKIAVLQQKQHLEILAGCFDEEGDPSLPHLKSIGVINYEQELPAGVIGLEPGGRNGSKTNKDQKSKK